MPEVVVGAEEIRIKVTFTREATLAVPVHTAATVPE